MKNVILPILALAVTASTAMAFVPTPVAIYRETFNTSEQNNPDRFRGSDGNDPITREQFDTGWSMFSGGNASQHGDVIQFYPGGEAPAATTGLRNNETPLAEDAPELNVFWSPKVARVVIYTEEFSWNLADVTSFSVDLGNRPNPADPVFWQLMLKVDGQWHIANELFTNLVNTPLTDDQRWVTLNADIRAFSYSTATVNPTFNIVTSPLDGAASDPFAGGTLEGWGFYAEQIVSNQYIDNATLYGVPEPATLGLLGAGVLGLFIVLRRRA